MATSWSGGERPTQAEIRHQRFVEAGALAKAIGDVALEDIDAVLADETVILDGLQQAVAENGMTPEEAEANFSAYRETREGQHSALFWVWMQDEKAHFKD